MNFYKGWTNGQKVTFMTALIGGFATVISALILRPVESDKKKEIKPPKADSSQSVTEKKTEAIPYPNSPNIKLIQFGVNEELSSYFQYEQRADSVCYTEGETLQYFFVGTELEKDTVLGIGPQGFRHIYETYFSEDLVSVSKEKPHNKKVNKSENPIFDMTFYHAGKNDLILVKIQMLIRYFGIMVGDSQPNETSHLVPMLHRYNIIIPDEERLEKALEIGFTRKKNKTFLISKNAVPPLVIKPRDPARIQLEIKTNVGYESVYVTELHFIFSNGQVLKKGLVMQI